MDSIVKFTINYIWNWTHSIHLSPTPFSTVFLSSSRYKILFEYSVTVRGTNTFPYEHCHVPSIYSIVFFACYKSKTFCIRGKFQDNTGFLNCKDEFFSGAGIWRWRLPTCINYDTYDLEVTSVLHLTVDLRFAKCSVVRISGDPAGTILWRI